MARALYGAELRQMLDAPTPRRYLPRAGNSHNVDVTAIQLRYWLRQADKYDDFGHELRFFPATVNWYLAR